jgi:hypothetical protein
MRRSEEVWFVANDGARYQSDAACLAHEALLVDIAAAMLPLGPPVVDKGCDFANGGGYIPHDPAAVKAARSALAALTVREEPWMSKSIGTTPPDEVHPSWFGRMTDDCNAILSTAWRRLCCIDSSGREWGQMYYALHPNEGTQEVWTAREPVAS